MMIDYENLGLANKSFEFELNKAFRRVLSSGWYILGEEVEQFELEFAEYCGAKYCVGVASGLDGFKINGYQYH